MMMILTGFGYLILLLLAWVGCFVLIFTASRACTIYEVRPIICRLFGLVKDDDRMICPYGCKPRIKERQVQRIMKPLLNRTDALYGPFDLGE